MTSRNTYGTNLCTCKSNGLKCVTACEDCRGYDCNNSNFTDCEIAETDILTLAQMKKMTSIKKTCLNEYLMNFSLCIQFLLVLRF